MNLSPTLRIIVASGVLLSGNEAKIRDWEYEQALLRTKRLRPDLL